MPTVIMRFPSGRYHATPWGHHVNEGLVEWPPCPWRLLRALIATGYATQGWMEMPTLARQLFETLANQLPTYQLPQVSAAHSRHYMPVGELSKGVEKTTLVFDTWANVGNDELAVCWNCQLDNDAAALFQTLVASLGYLGRSESWVDARVATNEFDFDKDRTAFPQVNGEYRGPEWEQVPLLAPVSPQSYAEWHKEKIDAALGEFSLPEGQHNPSKTLLRKRASAVEPYPKDLIECLQKDTAWWKKQHKWSQPPGSRRVLYWRRADSLMISRPRAARPLIAPAVQAILLTLATPTRNKSALPHVRRTLPQGELFHRAIVGRVGRGEKIDCPELTGRDEAGKPLQDGHRHSHVLPLDLDGDARIDHLLVHAPMGLGDAAQRAIRSLKRTWSKGGVGDLQVAVVGRGDLEFLRCLPEPFDRGVSQILGPTADSLRQGNATLGMQTWSSLTPFVPPRFVKRHGRNTIEGQVAAELKSRKLPDALQIEVLRDESISFRNYIRVRGHGGNPPPVDVGYSVRIKLPARISGPLSLGYGSHFGLGLFGYQQCDH